MSTTTKEKTEAVEAAEDAVDVDEGIDQVRDILFGSQMRAVDQRLAQLEGRFQRDLEAARSELSRQLSELEGRVEKQGDALTKKITTEREKRTEGIKGLRADMNKGLKSLDTSLGKLEDATSKADAELRDQMLELGKSLSADIKSLSDRLTKDMERYVQELRTEKTDIGSLVELYTDMARRLAEILGGSDGK